MSFYPPYYANTRKSLVKSPKLYFCDTGLACYLLDIESPEQLTSDKMRGPMFENFVVMEALKHRFNAGRESNLFQTGSVRLSISGHHECPEMDTSFYAIADYQ